MEMQLLRERAETELQTSPRSPSPFVEREEIEHELHVHEVELEMQNEELRSALQELEASRARYRDLFELAPVGYLVQGVNGISDANDAFAELLRTTKRKVVGKRLSAFVVPADVELLRAHERAVLGSGRRERVELRLVAEGGRAVVARLESVRVSDAARQWRTAVTDVTEERRLERQLVEAAREDARGPIARGMAHDFGHVLMSIVTQADRALACLKGGLSAEQPLDELKRAATEGAVMVTRLLDQARNADAAPQALSLDLALRELEPALRRVVGSGVRMQLDLRAQDACVALPEVELEQVLVNLATNARDAMPRGGDLTITTRALGDDGKSVQLRVADTGAGMDWETQAHAFEPFFTRKPRGVGTGLGLSTVYGVVKRAGGYIDLRSELDKGTSIKIVLPRVQAPARQLPVGAIGVLLVDDDAVVRRMARHALEAANYRVVEADSAEQALAKLRSDSHVQLLVTDFNLPGMNGSRLVGVAQTIVPGLRALVMSGSAPEGIALPEGVPFLAKPFVARDLLELAHEVLVEDAGSAPTVLFVDDDPRALVAYKELLWEQGFRALPVASAAEALELFRRRPESIAVLVTDLNLPDERGSWLAREVRRLRPELPVIYLSGERPGPDLLPELEDGRTKFVAKPAEISKLATALRALLAQRS